jgi:hypothetical protein
MICPAKPVLTEDLHIMQKEEFSITRYMCDTYTYMRDHVSICVFIMSFNIYFKTLSVAETASFGWYND